MNFIEATNKIKRDKIIKVLKDRGAKIISDAQNLAIFSVDRITLYLYEEGLYCSNLDDVISFCTYQEINTLDFTIKNSESISVIRDNNGVSLNISFEKKI